ncbi:MAG: 23S rRNA (adenine(2503)-C(2))-methyltransferase RlmN [Bacteroidales bacterium]|nr:23S rRNA (adenine(2503)-C(2))-methyltransferase RlmN [Bacteroidales bacterium]
MKIRLCGKTPEELVNIALSEGLPSFTGKQIGEWIYHKRVKSIADMTNLSKAAREKLSDKYEVGVSMPIDVMTSSDGTRKYLFPVRCPVVAGHDVVTPDLIGGLCVEAVMIPDGDRKTLCVSSQAGCKMGCKFCMTGRHGFHGNLSVADIVSQFLCVEESEELTGTVFMGMGEPLDNWESVKKVTEILTAPWGFAWSPKRITLSTIGVLPSLKEFLDGSKCHLAVSLHNPYPGERLEMMPVEKAFPIREVLELIRKYDFTGQRRVSFEYTVFKGWNDSPRHARELSKLLKGLECRVNLIRFHRIPDFPYSPASEAEMTAFRDRLNALGITATIRASRGKDIFAACGLLAGKHSQR